MTKIFLIVSAFLISCGTVSCVEPIPTPEPTQPVDTILVDTIPTIEPDPVPVEYALFTEWPAYNPTISYVFRDEYPDLEMPTENLPDGVTGVGWTYDDRWWTFTAGNKANHLVTEAAVKPLLERMNADFEYIRENMGWPPDNHIRNGYRSHVYLYGSGLSIDNADSTALGGWQGSVWAQSQSWPMVHISYYPVYCFDPACTYSDKDYQTNGVVHEGIHCILTSLPGCRDAGWFHEGTNTWLQRTMELERSMTTDYSQVDLGWLSMGSLLAPFIPIECYSGWLTNGSFGGPSAEGVSSSDTRNLLGGIQYSNVFPTFMEVAMGQESIPWVWQNCPKQVLIGMEKGLGADQMKRVIQEYRSRLCLSDLGKYTQSALALYKSYWGASVKSEGSSVVETWKASAYVKTTVDSLTGYLIPEERTLPGWSGANIIPFVVEEDADKVTVYFRPIDENMSCQLCFRTETGETVYSEPFYEGGCTIKLDGKKPANKVIFAVVCNLDYKYTSRIRTKHFDYRLKLGEGIKSAVKNINLRLYDWNNHISL